MNRSSKNPDQLTPKQRALYELLLQEKKGQLQAASTKAVERTIPKRQDLGPAPVSFPQQRLWVVDQLEAGRSSAYNVHITVQFTGALDILLLERCVNGVVRRHDSLRTVFAARDDGMPVQVVLSELRLHIPIEDISHLPKEAQDAEVERRTREESQRLFDLARGPLLRGKVLRLGPDDHVALVTMHHLVTDRWSLGVFVRELMALYAAEVTSQAADLSELVIQYPDFAAWQRGRMQGERLRAELDFWKQHLRTLPAPLELPTDRPRPPEQTYRGSRQFVTLPVALTRALKEVAQQEGATLFMTLLATFQTLLHRYSGQTDITVGSPIAGRNVPELESLIGFFVNTLVLRNHLDGDPTFRDLLRRAKAVCMAAYAHQELPFEKLVEELNPPRDLGRHPIFQVMFGFQNTPRQDLSMPGLKSTYLLVDPGSAKFDLLLELREDRPDEIFGWFEYNTDLFDAATLQRLRGHFYTLMDAVAANPDQRLSALPLMNAEEQRQLLVDGNGPRAEYPRDMPMHELFAHHSARAPQAVAVEHEGRTLTYAELDARANQLARHLLSLGLRPEARVGLCVERGPDLVTGMLGILKAGGVYVPLDPAYPRQRLAFMFEDSSVAVVLTQQPLRPLLPPHSRPTVCLDSDWPVISREPVEPPTGIRVSSDQLAYVLYTSGSTGKPKGVAISHRSIVHLVRDTNYVDLGPDDCMAQVGTPSFDAATFELWGALLNGARLVIIPRDVLLSPEDLALRLAEVKATCALLTTALFNQVAHEKPSAFSAMRYVFFGGEKASPQAVRQVLHAGRPGQLVNLYGPTEVTVCATFHPLLSLPAGATSVPIGRPLARMRLYVLDAHGRPVPRGVPGELYVGGDGLARGYLGRPDLTAERFVPDALSGELGARLYRTGDMVRWLQDGTLDFVGRVDTQVKVRGRRIEPGEIEAALREHPSVHEAVVLVREDVPGTVRLVAYCVPSASEEGAALDVQALRTALAERLPEFMVPSAFVVLRELPLSPSGKVDREALSAPDAKPPEAGGDRVEPRTPQEKALAAVWTQLLGVPRVSPDDNFFELGGDSILAIQVVSRARQAGLHLAASQLFQHQTLEALARVAKQQGTPRAEQGLVLGEVALTPIQHDFFEKHLPQANHFNQAVMLSASEKVDVPSLEKALHAVVAHHDALRLRFTRRLDGTWQQQLAGLEAPMRLEQIRLSSASGEDSSQALEAEATRLHASLRLDEGLLLRAALFDFGPEQEQKLLLAVHHLAVDGVSWRTLLEDLGTAYVQITQGRPVTLPPKSTSFKTWASKLAIFASSESVASELPYWLEQGQAQAHALPMDGPGGEISVASSRVVEVSLDEEETRLLLRETPTAWRAHINDVLLTALAESLTRWTGQPKLRVELEGHGREALFDDVDLSRTVGWHTALYPVVLDVSDTASLGDRLRAVRDTLRRLPRRGLGYGLLRHLADPEQARRLRTQPRAQVLFNYLGQFNQAPEGGMTLPFHATREPMGATRAPEAPLSHLLEVNGYVFEGRLTLAWTYSQAAHREETIQLLAQRFLGALRELIAARESADVHRYTPTDFPLARLEQAELDRLLPSGTAVEDLYPLSPLQQGMLFHTRMAPASGVYVTQLTWTFGGTVDLGALRRTWDVVVARQPMLRTAFLTEGMEEPLQQVHARAELPWSELDWRGVPEAEHPSRFQSLLDEDRARGFDLRTPPLMRLTVVRLDERTHHVLWTFHHLVLDGWSLGLLFQELFTTYASVRVGRKPPARSDAPAFREHIAWLQQQPLEAAEAFWREALKGFTAPTPLPGALPKSTGAALQRKHLRVHLGARATTSLQAFVRQHQLTLNAVVQAAWALVLSRLTGEQDILFGATGSGRSTVLPGIDRALGLFINTLPIRIQVDDQAPVLSWLKRLQEQQLELRQYEHTPLVRVQGWSDVARGTPLFESLFILENYPVDAAVGSASAELGIRDFRALEQADTALEAYVIPGASLELRLLFDAARFEAAAPERLLRHWSAALEALLARPEERLGHVSLLTGDERDQVLRAWNDTTRAYNSACLHQQFEAQVTRTPDAPALSFVDEHLTYRQLHQRVLRLSARLQRLGVCSDTLVGLSLERSPDMVAAMLAILHAGGAYLPLDPDYPTERLAWMLQDSGAQVLLTSRHLLGTLPATGVPVLLIDEETSDEARAPGASMPDHLAYVIYTSGSTGLPKGVMVPHRTAANFLGAMDALLGTSTPGIWLAVTSISFDISVLELLWTLTRGYHVVLHDERTASRRGTAPSLHEALSRHAITHLQCTPAFARGRVLAAESVPALGSLRHLLVGGEAMPGHLAARLREALPSATLTNLYGPTETTVWSSTHSVSDGDTGVATVSIGAPIANTRLYVLDASGQPVPTGAPGELFIAGDGVVRGYLGRPELTAERFVPDAFSGVPGGRLYRTGDLARWRHDGTLDFLGRTDFQVKVRGFRIESGEVEAVLSRHPSVQQAVASVHRDASGDGRLVAYVVPTPSARAEDTLDTSALRDFLREHLPEHMVPSFFIALDAFPLTPNGKVDRKALPAPEQQDSRRPYVAPRTQTEEQLAGLFAQVLGPQRVGATDSFFELGGHSLLATQVVSRIHAALGVTLPLRVLFESPTVEQLARQVDAAKRSPGLAPPPLRPAPRDGVIPLSFAQQRLWFLDQLQPGAATYNLPSALKLEGAVDVGALREALQSLVRRHESLRTTFVVRDGEPTQHVHAGLPLELPVSDLSAMSEAVREDEARRLVHEEAQRPFDLASGPLVRATLVRLTPEQHLLLVTLHHIISDGWSSAIMVRELGAYYRERTGGPPAHLAPLAVQYADYSVWQRQWLQGDVLKQELDWWREQLAGAPSAMELPTDRPRPAVQTHRGARLPVTLPRSVSEAVTALARREGATPFMVLLASWQLLLARYSGQDDVCVGSPIANRTRAETEGLIGFFVNTLVLRARLEGNPSFRQLLAQVREVTLGAYAHQDVPFEKLVQELQPERDLSRAPLFQVMFILQNAPVSSIRLPGLRMEAAEAGGGSTAKFDLTLSLSESAEGLSGVLEFNTDLFEQATMARLLGHLRVLLEGLVVHPEQPVFSLPLLDAAERRKLLVDWSDGGATDPSDLCLHTLFEQQALHTPDAVALVAGTEALTYRELDQRANHLAHRLRGLGVGPEVRVGVCAERSASLLVSLLGILKAGGAYVPLDPAYPRQRLAVMLEDARPLVLVGQRQLLDSLPPCDATRVELDTGPALAEARTHGPRSGVTAEHLSYVLYTSGSTGGPKGVALEHRSAVAFLRWAARAFSEAELAGVLASTSINFDLSVFEFFAPLSVGGAVVLAQNALELPELPAASRVTLINTVPSAMTELVRARAIPSSVLTVNLAGEPLPGALVKSIHLAAPHVERVNNLYGPTEDTTYSTWAQAPRDGSEPAIGRPLTGTRAYVLDALLQPVPVGVEGELYLAGAGLARGYFGRPELTAERFVPDAFSPEPGTRMYRTGDRVRWREDGSLRYGGRIDQQVKVRGFRIELGEVEAALRRHGQVREAIALVREDAPGDKRLVAYVVAPGTSSASLKDVLRQTLPEYMRPSALVLLDSLPLTPNGKVDRRALPAPESTGSQGRQYLEPRTGTEQRLAMLWTEVLGAARPGLDDDFFELGGHSLLAIQVVSRIRAAFGVALPLGALFEHRNLEALARALEQLGADVSRTGGAETEVSARLALKRPTALGRATGPASIAQRRWLGYAGSNPSRPRSTGNVPLCVRITGRLDIPALERALTALVERHEVLRTHFARSDEGFVFQVSPPEPVRLDQREFSWMPREEREEEVRHRVTQDTSLPFDLLASPMFRAWLYMLGPEEHVLLVMTHHIAWDGWSEAILIQEVGLAYEACSRGEEPLLHELRIQYSDFAWWQHEQLRGAHLESLESYWRRQLAGGVSMVDFPLDKPRPDTRSYSTLSATSHFPARLSAAIKALSQREGATLYMIAMAAYQSLLALRSGARDVSVFSNIGTREHLDVENLIGCFTNIVLIRTHLEGDPTFQELLARVRESVLGALAHSALPYQRVLDMIGQNPDSQSARTFPGLNLQTFQKAGASELALEGLQLDRLSIPQSGNLMVNMFFFISESEDSVSVTAKANGDLYEARTVERIVEDFQRLLEVACANPDLRLSELLCGEGPGRATGRKSPTK
ncbi:amino acid adenylation domain-containing protein [Corallococcus terminator]